MTGKLKEIHSGTKNNFLSAVTLAYGEMHTLYTMDKKFVYNNSEMCTNIRNQEMNAAFQKHLYH